jgi:methionine-rich copper-binding protein CopC
MNRPTRARITTAALGVAAGLLLVVGAASPAQAHDALVGSTPEENSTVDTVDGITLTFSDVLLNLEGVESAFAIQVLGPDGRYYTDGCVTLAGAEISATAELGAPGTYEVLWQVVSADGHPISDRYSFDYQPAADMTAAEGRAEQPVCDATGGASEPEPTVAAPGEGDRAAPSGLAVGLAIGAVVVAAATVGTIMLLRRMRR